MISQPQEPALIRRKFDSGRWLRFLSVVLGLITLIVTLPHYWTALRAPAVGIYHDDSIYILTARSLALGEGYRIPSVPGQFAQTKYPILFPALLAGIWKAAPAFPENVFLLKLVPCLCAFWWLFLAHRLIVRETQNPLVATAIVALTAACPMVVLLSTAVMSETLFAALATACLLLLRRCEQSPEIGLILGAALLAGAAYHTRSIGVCLMAAGFAALLTRKHYRFAMIFAAACALLAAPWLCWQFIHRNVPDPYLSYANYYRDYNAILNFSWAEKQRIVSANLVSFLSSPASFFKIAGGLLPGIAITPFLLKGFFRRDRSIAVRLFVALSGILIVLWASPSARFIVPMLPLMLLFVWDGSPRRARALLIPFMVGLMVSCAVSNRCSSAEAQSSGCWSPEKFGETDWWAFEELMGWVKVNTPKIAVIEADLDPTVTLFTGRYATRGMLGNLGLKAYLPSARVAGDVREFRRGLLRDNISYVVSAPFHPKSLHRELLAENVEQHPNEFTLVHHGLAPGFEVYAYQPYGVEPSGTAAKHR